MNILFGALKQIIKLGSRYFIPLTLLMSKFIEASGSTSTPIQPSNMTDLVNVSEIGFNSPTITTYLGNDHEPGRTVTHHRFHQELLDDSILYQYLADSKNSHSEVIKIKDSSEILKRTVVPLFSKNKSAFCQVNNVNFIDDLDDCLGVDVKTLNAKYQEAQTLRQQNTRNSITASINTYNEILRLVPDEDPYYNPLFKLIYWHLGSSYSKLLNVKKIREQLEEFNPALLDPTTLIQARTSFERAIALATDAQYLGDIYSRYGIILSWQGEYEMAHLAHLKASQLMPENEDAKKLVDKSAEELLIVQSNNANSRHRQSLRM